MRFYIAAWCNGSTTGFDPVGVSPNLTVAAIWRRNPNGKGAVC